MKPRVLVGLLVVFALVVFPPLMFLHLLPTLGRWVDEGLLTRNMGWLLMFYVSVTPLMLMGLAAWFSDRKVTA